ncbi:hypothetical protein [Emergencia timonensis]
MKDHAVLDEQNALAKAGGIGIMVTIRIVACSSRFRPDSFSIRLLRS